MNPISEAAMVLTVHKEPAAAAPAAATASTAAGAAAAAGASSASSASSTTCAAGAAGAAGAAAAASPAPFRDRVAAAILNGSPFPEEEPFVCGQHNVVRVLVPGSTTFSYYPCGKIRFY